MARGDLALVLMAAGKGTRMRSRLPKVLHTVCGRPILLHALELGRQLGAKRRVVVVGSGEDQVREAVRGMDVSSCARPSSSAPRTPRSRRAGVGGRGPGVS
jgi:bifunctional N-acetylglucosamine-1-phosphate-uridyltransferase/glucosamine-1-phosphate-acetyltransferase GlmU-like protein